MLWNFAKNSKNFGYQKTLNFWKILKKIEKLGNFCQKKIFGKKNFGKF